MTSLKEAAEGYEPSKTKNIAELEAVSTAQEIKTETRTNNEGKDYKTSFIELNNLEYRVPASVLEQVQSILKVKPDLKTFKVEKKGEGMNTKYTVIQLE
ncbi:MAG: hypothetical protein ACTSQ4_02235 [Candidatus Heimdallarchaeaceae archaeon]